MHHEPETRTRQGMEERIKQLESMLRTMQSDFAECARGVSPCFFCANDETCESEKDCNFIWVRHND